MRKYESERISYVPGQKPLNEISNILVVNPCSKYIIINLLLLIIILYYY